MDITMCLNGECTQKHECWRYVAPPSEYQSYGSFEEIDGYCEYFYPLSK